MVLTLAKKARKAFGVLANLSTQQKNKVLSSMSQALLSNQRFIINENKKDLKRAKARRLSSAFIDRLALTKARIKEMSASQKALINLSDPVGEVIKQWKAPNGLKITKVRVPIGVIAIIYESRPDVTSDCIGLCLKSGNCVILRGGSEAINSNKAIYKVLSSVLARVRVKCSLMMRLRILYRFLMPTSASGRRLHPSYWKYPMQQTQGFYWIIQQVVKVQT